MKSIPNLKTERLKLRPFSLADASDVQRLVGDRSIADTTLHIPHPYMNGEAEKWIAMHQPEFDRGRCVTFAVTRKTDGVLVGAIGLSGMVAGHQAELGYWIGQPYWNQGFCTEAGRAVLRYAFSKFRLIRVHGIHFSRNPASGQVMRKLGMRHEGSRRQHVRKWDLFEDIELYGILKTDWLHSDRKSSRS
ncbi:MAG TPA: GNAT family N-acetyltransferase [Verrucomicrobiae bacterium]